MGWGDALPGPLGALPGSLCLVLSLFVMRWVKSGKKPSLSPAALGSSAVSVPQETLKVTASLVVV